MKTSILVAFALLMGSFASAGSRTTKTATSPTTSRVKIVVKDSETKETVPCASITISGNNTPATFQRTGLNGECEVELTLGEYEINVSSAGFKDVKTVKVTSIKAEESTYSVNMEPILIDPTRTF